MFLVYETRYMHSPTLEAAMPRYKSKSLIGTLSITNVSFACYTKALSELKSTGVQQDREECRRNKLNNTRIFQDIHNDISITGQFRSLSSNK